MSSIDHLSEINDEWEYPSFDISEENIAEKLIFCMPDCDQCLRFDDIDKYFKLLEENFTGTIKYIKGSIDKKVSEMKKFHKSLMV